MVDLAERPTPTTFPVAPTEVPRATARLEGLLAALVAIAAGVVVLVRTPRLLEPDDSAYRASIVALSRGHLTLSSAQYHALARQLQGGITQWVRLSDGRFMSEKNPGYPFLAVAFQWLHVERLTPLCFGALACVALFAGARRWLGPWGGTLAVCLYVSSGAALAFAWRALMPTFTDASLVATGAGALLWVLLATDATPRRRRLVGVGAFVALELAVFTRYTDVVALLVACVVVLVARRAAGLGRRTVGVWLATAVAFGAADLAFNARYYGGPLHTGYGPGEVSFSLSALPTNLLHLTGPLLESMPLAIAAAAGLCWILVRGRRARRATAVDGQRRVDRAVALGLGALWLGTWGLYELYVWTAQMGTRGGAIHVIRFYLPALGALALLGAWALRRLPWRWAAGAVCALAVAGLVSFSSLVAVPSLGAGPLGPGAAGVPGQFGPPPGGPGGQVPPPLGGPN